MDLFDIKINTSFQTEGRVTANGTDIVTVARTQIGVPYSWGGGGFMGKSIGIKEGDSDGSHTVGFDCSGLTQYAVYKGTGKVIKRNSYDQYEDKECRHVPYANHQPGDLVFFNDSPSHKIHHVAIISGPDMMIHAPHTGDHVREGQIYTKGRVEFVQRCV